MSLDFNLTNAASTKDEWLTPPSIIKRLGEFDLDPCSPIVRPWDTAKTHYDINADGLKMPWFGRVWCNPPYGEHTFTWIEKLADHGNGVALIFARTETKGFHRQIWERADALLFIEGRLKFFHVDGTPGNAANAPSVLVAFGEQNVDALKRCGLKGAFVKLNCGA